MNDVFQCSPGSCAIPRSGGFSLIEVVFALGIVVFACSALATLIPIGLSNTKVSRQETQYLLVSRSILASLRSKIPHLPPVDGAGALETIRFDSDGHVQGLYFDSHGRRAGALESGGCQAEVRWHADPEKPRLYRVELILTSPDKSSTFLPTLVFH